MTPDRRPIVVGGCHRSGTSLLRRIVGAHSRIHCGPEVPFFRDFHGDYRDDPLHHLRFATNARELLAEQELLDVLGRAFVEIHERAAANAGKPRWADKAPENVLYTREWELVLGSDWLMLHVVRNPLDTIASIAEARFPLTLPSELDRRIAWYRRYTEAGLAFGDEHPERYRPVVYEALCESPEAVVGSLMAWVGEEFEPRQLRLGEGVAPSGLEDPKVAETTTVHHNSIGRWRQLLSADEAAEAWSKTDDLWQRIDPDARYRPSLEPTGTRP